jgi:hypothetical protein
MRIAAMPDVTNDNHLETGAPAREPDAHGQAALLLVESLIHDLVARAVISVDEAVEIVEVAAEVKAEVAAELGDSPATMRHSLALLESIGRSLRGDASNG